MLKQTYYLAAIIASFPFVAVIGSRVWAQGVFITNNELLVLNDDYVLDLQGGKEVLRGGVKVIGNSLYSPSAGATFTNGDLRLAQIGPYMFFSRNGSIRNEANAVRRGDFDSRFENSEFENAGIIDVSRGDVTLDLIDSAWRNHGAFSGSEAGQFNISNSHIANSGSLDVGRNGAVSMNFVDSGFVNSGKVWLGGDDDALESHVDLQASSWTNYGIQESGEAHWNLIGSRLFNSGRFHVGDVELDEKSSLTSAASSTFIADSLTNQGELSLHGGAHFVNELSSSGSLFVGSGTRLTSKRVFLGHGGSFIASLKPDSYEPVLSISQWDGTTRLARS